MRILVVDDDVRVCETIRKMFERNGYEAKCAHTSLEAADMVSRESFALAVIDWDLSGTISGVELGRSLRRMGMGTFMISGYSKAAIRGAWRDPLEGFLQFYEKGDPNFTRDLLIGADRVRRSIEDTQP
jgi:DNA-binding NtrC family response regulator